MGVIDNIKKKVKKTGKRKRAASMRSPRSSPTKETSHSANNGDRVMSSTRSKAEAPNFGSRKSSSSARRMLRELALVEEDTSSATAEISSSEPDSSEGGDDLLFGLDSSTTQVALLAREARYVEEQDALVTRDATLAMTNDSSEDSPGDLGQSLLISASDVEALVGTPEMQRVFSSSHSVACQLAGTAWHVACLPVTVPVNVVRATTSTVVGTCVHAAHQSIGWVDDHVLKHSSAGEDSFQGRVDGLVQHVVTNVVPVVLQTAGLVKDQVGSAVLGLLFGGSDGHQARAETSAEQSSFLDRLRLDYQMDVIHEADEEDETSEDSWRPSSRGSTLSNTTPSTASPRRHARSFSSRRAYLLYVADLGLEVPYVNLKDESEIVSQTLDALVRDGVGLCMSHDETRSSAGTAIQASQKIEWRGEACTDKYIRKKAQKRLTEEAWLSLLEREVLVWSGKAEDSNTPYFLSRGIVPGSPEAFKQLLWDNARTTEYNRFCMGRSNQLVLGDETITKVVRSETKVPFTGMTVHLSTLMHTVQLEDGSYVIASRSLKPKGEAKSEIIWGMNWIRAVPNEPNKSDLISLSQIRSALVPNFLTNRVGVMGVEQTYGAFRSLEYLNSAAAATTTTSSTNKP